MTRMKKLVSLTLAAALLCPNAAFALPHGKARNVVIFVPDGLRAAIVDEKTAPAMFGLEQRGVRFTDSHSIFPTFTTTNAASMATGHLPGDTGDFSNTIYSGFSVPSAAGSWTPFLESDAVLGDVDEHFNGNYLNEDTILALARAGGMSTATIGKVGPVLIFDHTERTGKQTIVIDDQTGTPAGIPLNDDLKAALTAAGLPLAAPTRGDNGKPGDYKTPGTKSANVDQQRYFIDAATKAVLPQFKARNKPFALVFWSRDPDGTQHNQGDSLNSLTPGINGPTSMASIKNADDDLAQLLEALRTLGLADSTDVVVMADHGFSTISKQSKTSPSASVSYTDVPAGFLPPGFVAIDIAKALAMPLSDPDKDDLTVDLSLGQHPARGNGLIGYNVSAPDVAVAANGGSDLIYLPQSNARELAPRVINTLLAQDYVSGIFVDDRLGRFPGALPLSAIGLFGSAATPIPAIAVNFASSIDGCAIPVKCAVEIADTTLQQGQGMHGTFSRADTKNFMAVAGPDFRAGYTDALPVSNADWGRTIAALFGMKPADHGTLIGRVVTEALIGGTAPKAELNVLRSAPSSGGLVTELKVQRVGSVSYFTAAGFSGRTVGL
jgi:arylsulfatase A-like enzyme